MRVAVLDDYFNIALSVANWSPVNGRADVKVFNEHLGDENNVITAPVSYTHLTLPTTPYV